MPRSSRCAVPRSCIVAGRFGGMHWRARLANPAESPVLAELVADGGSLTARLRALGAFSVVRLRQRLSRPRVDEAGLLGLSAKQRLLLVREVILRVDGQPVVLARSLLPLSLVHRAEGLRLARLGRRPLGEALFTDARIQRLPMRFSRLRAGASGHHLSLKAGGHGHCPARASLFLIGRQRLLVCEIFLPTLLPLLHDKSGYDKSRDDKNLHDNGLHEQSSTTG